MMITVKIRHTAETEGTDIGDFTPAELESIVQTSENTELGFHLMPTQMIINLHSKTLNTISNKESLKS